jgi:hypothetical protein
MVKQVKNIDGFFQSSVFQHDQFFHEMGHGVKRKKDHNDRKHDEYRIGYLVEKCPHEITCEKV